MFLLCHLTISVLDFVFCYWTALNNFASAKKSFWCSALTKWKCLLAFAHFGPHHAFHHGLSVNYVLVFKTMSLLASYHIYNS